MTTTSIPRPALAPLLSLCFLLPSACVEPDDELDLVEDLEEDAAFEFRTAGKDLPASQVCSNVLNDGIGLMRYCRNRNIYVDNSSVERAIIVIHGSGLDAKNYYNKTVAEAIAEGVDLSKTDIIAPQYFEASFPLGFPAGTWDDYYKWSAYWRWGHLATSHNRSSFAMIDHIVGQLMDHRPNLEMIVVAGQSAGGQFVDRYAVGTEVDHTGVDMRFWAANPRGNVWYTNDRPEATCSGYNNYGYGLDNRNTYMSNSTVAEIRERAVTRDIFWTVGENDTAVASNPGDPCQVNAKGAHRQERWENHRDHVADLCLAEGYSGWYCLFHTARHIEIPGCGHGSNCSWASDEGHDILFGP